MERATMARQEVLRARIAELVGDVESVGTLRRQAADLGVELGDYGVAMAIDRETDGEWMPSAVRYKYAQFFTHWVVLAITRLADRQRDSTSIPALVRRLDGLRKEGELRRDRWVERMVGITRWREARDGEERARIERLIAERGGAIWSRIGPGEEAARLSELWNRPDGPPEGRRRSSRRRGGVDPRQRESPARASGGSGGSGMARHERGASGPTRDA